MRTLAILRSALSGGAFAVVLTGCAGSPPPIIAPGPMSHRVHTSWFDAAKAKKVKGGYLYVSDLATDVVYLYGYDSKTMTLTPMGGEGGFEAPYGSCSDANGNVYVTDFLALTITEFAFGTLNETRTLSEHAGEPEGCSVDPTSGDLAVAYFNGLYFANGGVLIYKNARGIPEQHNGAFYDWTAGYDPKGNLWVEGDNASEDGYVMELPKGGRFLKTVTFDRPLYLPSGVQWDGKYLDVSDQMYDDTYQIALYQTKISGSKLTTVNTVLPTSTCHAGVDFFTWASIAASPNDLPKTQATQIVAGNLLCNYQYDVWTFPAGGSAAAELRGPSYPTGQTYVAK
jgi:hypothetical protein